MAKAKKLKSGNWRTQVYDYTDINGKKHYKSFTAATKKESEYLASVYSTGRSDVNVEYDTITVYEAIKQYIDIKENALSPTTITGYICCLKNSYKEIQSRNINDLNSAILQRWIGDLSKRVSPKTVSNAYGLLRSALNMFDFEKKISVTLPQRILKSNYIPTDADIKLLINYFEEKNKNMLIATYLSAFGTLRRSEICALTADDVQGNSVIINKAMVQNKNRKWIIKETPKNLSSNRIVQYPSFVINVLPNEGRLVNLNPNTVSEYFLKALRTLELPHFRFHDLRHYSASIMHAIGIPDVYIMKRGGWSDDTTLKKIYRNSLTDFEQKYMAQTLEHFDKISHEISHEK